MSYLLDTNVVSEWVKPEPNPRVVQWLDRADEDRTFLSVVVFAEIAHGIAAMPDSRRRAALSAWLEQDLQARFEGRILLVDLPVAASWGGTMARAQNLGLGLNAIDAFFVATAQVHGLTLVTRNTKHFEKLGITFVNPWHE